MLSIRPASNKEIFFSIGFRNYPGSSIYRSKSISRSKCEYTVLKSVLCNMVLINTIITYLRYPINKVILTAKRRNDIYFHNLTQILEYKLFSYFTFFLQFSPPPNIFNVCYALCCLNKEMKT